MKNWGILFVYGAISLAPLTKFYWIITNSIAVTMLFLTYSSYKSVKNPPSSVMLSLISLSLLF